MGIWMPEIGSTLYHEPIWHLTEKYKKFCIDSSNNLSVGTAWMTPKIGINFGANMACNG